MPLSRHANLLMLALVMLSLVAACFLAAPSRAAAPANDAPDPIPVAASGPLTVESTFHRPVEGNDVGFIVVIVHETLREEQVQQLLEGQIGAVRALTGFSMNLCASARLADDPDPDRPGWLRLPDGSQSLWYSKDHDRTYTGRTFEKVVGIKVEPTFVVTLDATLVRRDDGKAIRIEGKSNLPTGTKLIATYTRDGHEDAIPAGEVIEVKDGSFASDWFERQPHLVGEILGIRYIGLKGRELTAGQYTLRIAIASPKDQPPKVQRYIGKKGELLAGASVKKDQFGTSRSAEFEFPVLLE